MVEFAGDTVGEVKCVMMLIREGLQDRSENGNVWLSLVSAHSCSKEESEGLPTHHLAVL